MRVLFVRCPRQIWANINEDDNFLAPLNFPCVAAWLRKVNPDVEVRILDCCAERMGWASLEAYLRQNRYDIVGIGDETFNAWGGYQVLKMVRAFWPDTITVAGGRHFPYMLEESFGSGLIDYIVRDEGEVTFAELVATLMGGDRDLSKVHGIAYRARDGQIVLPPPRELMRDLDDLPMPAYDLIPMDQYSRRSKLNPNSVTYFHSRGCNYGCGFCTFWPQDGLNELVDGEWRKTPYYRTKSVEKTVDEIEELIREYGKTYIYFVDPTFDAIPQWNEGFADEVLRRGLKFNFWAYMRADTILRDEEAGIFEKMVAAGLAHPLIGGERASDDDVAFTSTGWKNGGATKTAQVMDLFTRRYPQLVKHVTFMGGMREDTKESLDALADHAKTLKLDIASLLFYTPMPGTEIWEKAIKEDWLEITDFRRWDWFTAVMPTKTMTRKEVEDYWTFKILTVNFSNVWYKIKRQFSPYESVKRVNRYGAMMAWRYLKALVKAPFQSEKKFRGMTNPPWYWD